MIDDARDKSTALEPDAGAAADRRVAAPARGAQAASLTALPQLTTDAANPTNSPAPCADGALRGAAAGACGERSSVLQDDVPDVTAAPDVARASGIRGGSDARRRGWFWHWNSIVTQYAPLVGLKGIGLLNSYTVWTDRRDESPHRGYAFPSQQSEADFYGEERSELITINKLLVTLDLLEIRKEMFTRVDDAGRRWRVPHNLYRVKDRDDGWMLRAEDVLRVAQIASTDAAVFRYVRRVFSSRFKPIDRDNPWHAILEVVQQDPTWQALRQRAEETERRASARSRAGHAARAQRGLAAAAADAQAAALPAHDEFGACSNAMLTTGHVDLDVCSSGEQSDLDHARRPTSVADGNHASAWAARDVAHANTGLVDAHGAAVDARNTAWPRFETTIAPPSNAAGGASVAPSNTTEYQANPTTTTTTTTPPDADTWDGGGGGGGGGGDEDMPTLASDAAANAAGARRTSVTLRTSDMDAAPSASRPQPQPQPATAADASARKRLPAAEARRPLTIDDGQRGQDGGVTHASAAEAARPARLAQVKLATAIEIEDEEHEDGAHERRWDDDTSHGSTGAMRGGRRRHPGVGDARLAGADEGLGERALGAAARDAAPLDAAGERTDGSVDAAVGVEGARPERESSSAAQPAVGGAVASLVERPSDAAHTAWQPTAAPDPGSGVGRTQPAEEPAVNWATATGDRHAGAGAGGRDQQRRLADPRGGGPVGDPSDLVVSLFEAANDRRSTPLERILLAELERAADPAARADGADGATWVAAALRDAVAAGSRFVAPRRIQEIITRWANEGTTTAASTTATRAADVAARSAAGGVAAAAPGAGGATLASRTTADAGGGAGRRRTPARAADAVTPLPANAGAAFARRDEHAAAPVAGTTSGAPDAPPNVRLPGGASGAAVCRRTLAELAQALDDVTFERLLAGSSIVGYREGTVEVRVANAAAADALSTGYRALVERRLNAQLRQPVAARFSAAPETASVAAHEQPGDGAPVPPPDGPLVVTSADLDLGRQLWRVALASLAADVPADEAQRLANVAVLGQAADEALLLAAPTPQSARLLERRRAAVERVLAELLGRRVDIRALGADAWVVGD